MNLVLLGPPGAGKGTQAARIVEKYAIPHISTGDIFRKNIKEGTELGKKAQEYMNKGELVPDSLVIEIALDRLNEDDCKVGFLLDGFPRTVEQAEALDAYLADKGQQVDKVLDMDVKKEILMERLTGRRVCKDCGATYNVVGMPPKKEGVCDVCGGELVVRKDDIPETVRHRLEVFHQETEALKGFYQKLGKLRLIEGNQPIEDVTRDIMTALGV